MYGLKKMKFYSTKSPQIDFIQTDIFQDTYMYLIPTGVNRKSTSILETIEFKDDRLLKLVTDMEKSLLSNDDQSFHNIIKEGWQKKKETSKYIDQDVSIKNLDKELSVDKNILSHRLCGAGNGGFFLVFTKSFSEKNTKINYFRRIYERGSSIFDISIYHPHWSYSHGYCHKVFSGWSNNSYHLHSNQSLTRYRKVWVLTRLPGKTCTINGVFRSGRVLHKMWE